MLTVVEATECYLLHGHQRLSGYALEEIISMEPACRKRQKLVGLTFKASKRLREQQQPSQMRDNRESFRERAEHAEASAQIFHKLPSS